MLYRVPCESKKVQSEETEKKKLLRTCGIIFGVIGGTYVISSIAMTLLISATITYNM